MMRISRNPSKVISLQMSLWMTRIRKHMFTNIFKAGMKTSILALSSSKSMTPSNPRSGTYASRKHMILSSYSKLISRKSKAKSSHLMINLLKKQSKEITGSRLNSMPCRRSRILWLPLSWSYSFGTWMTESSTPTGTRSRKTRNKGRCSSIRFWERSNHSKDNLLIPSRSWCIWETGTRAIPSLWCHRIRLTSSEMRGTSGALMLIRRSVLATKFLYFQIYALHTTSSLSHISEIWAE